MTAATETNYRLSEAMEAALTWTAREARNRSNHYDERGLWRLPAYWDKQTRDALIRRGLIEAEKTDGNPWNGYRLTAEGKAVAEQLADAEQTRMDRSVLVRKMAWWVGNHDEPLAKLVADAEASAMRSAANALRKGAA